MDAVLQKSIKGWLPYALGALFVVLFAALGVWQISRAMEKVADQRAYESQSGFTTFVNGMDLQPYQRVEAEGEFDAAHQVLLDNIIVNSRHGHYVLTPLVYSDSEPALIVNRGWTERKGETVAPAVLSVGEGRLAVRGRVGALPRAGFRMGEAFEGPGAWPRHAVYPTLDELALALGRELQPFVLLMDPDDDYGLLRNWVPEEMGPGRHYGYAFQWFAMGTVLAGLLVWNHRKRGFET